jgi:hypothetical protein
MKSDEIGGYVAFMGDRRAVCRLWWGNLKERDHSDRLGIAARIILKGTKEFRVCLEWIDPAQVGTSGRQL